jgi:hypothetical protein
MNVTSQNISVISFLGRFSSDCTSNLKIFLHKTVHCLFAEWGGWSKCSHSCGNSNGAGTRIRYRYIAVEARYGGMRCYGSKDECSPCIHCASKPPGYDGPCIGFCPGKVLAIVVLFVGLEKFFKFDPIKNSKLAEIMGNLNNLNTFIIACIIYYSGC